MSFINIKCYFQSWSDLRLHFTQKCGASNFPLLPRWPFCSSVWQYSPTESVEVFLRSNMPLLLLFIVKCTDRIDDPFASVCFLKTKKVYFGLFCWFCGCQPFVFCCCGHFCLHITTCACPNWRTCSFLDYYLQSVIFIFLLSLEL